MDQPLFRILARSRAVHAFKANLDALRRPEFREAALSTPGGDNQDQSLTQLLLNVIEFGMSAEAAVEAPRFQTKHLVSSFDNHSMSAGVLLLDSRIDPAVVNEMNRRGHRVRTRSEWSSGSAPTIIRMYPSGVIEAGADPWGYRRAHAW